MIMTKDVNYWSFFLYDYFKLNNYNNYLNCINKLFTLIKFIKIL